jgi:hypothetical protein
VTNNNGFWIGWLDILALWLQLQSIIAGHNQWPSKTCSIPYWTTSAFSSDATDLVLIYVSVTSSASVVRWLALHSWTVTNASLNSLTNQFTNELSFISLGEPTRDHHLKLFVYYCYYFCFFRCYETCLANRCPAVDYFVSIHCSWKVCPLWLHYPDFQASCHNMKRRWNSGKAWHHWV